MTLFAGIKLMIATAILVTSLLVMILFRFFKWQ